MRNIAACSESIKALLVDNTSTNPGWKEGLVVKLKELLNRKLQTVGCALHQFELQLKAVFKKLNGESAGPRTFSGKIVKNCAENVCEVTQELFNKIVIPYKNTTLQLLCKIIFTPYREFFLNTVKLLNAARLTTDKLLGKVILCIMCDL